MSDEYTPTTGVVKHKYVLERMMDADRDGVPVMPTRRFHDEFTRWLTAHDREVASKAWDEGFAHGFNSNDYKMTNPYREGATK